MADYLFTWKPDRWPHEELRGVIDHFSSNRATSELWRCSAYRKIRFGDNAYLLKQGKPIGIFGRGTVVGKARKSRDQRAGVNPWAVPIGFDASRGDVVWDPNERFLVSEDQIRLLSAPEYRWGTQASGVSLEAGAAREIDNLIFDSVRVGRSELTPADEIVTEVLRRRRVAEQSIRPDQQQFRATILRNYGDSCAITGCSTPEALEAAHISTKSGRDDNSPTNGILLRSDIHILFDRLLITLSEDGRRLEISPKLIDPSYDFMRSVMVARPLSHPPSGQSIKQHRDLFFQNQRVHVSLRSAQAQS